VVTRPQLEDVSLLLPKPPVRFHLALDAVFPRMVPVRTLVSSQGLMGRHSRVQFGQKFRVFWVKLVLSCWVPATAGPRVCSALVMAEVKFGGSLGCADPEKDPAVCWMS